MIVGLASCATNDSPESTENSIEKDDSIDTSVVLQLFQSKTAQLKSEIDDIQTEAQELRKLGVQPLELRASNLIYFANWESNKYKNELFQIQLKHAPRYDSLISDLEDKSIALGDLEDAMEELKHPTPISFSMGIHEGFIREQIIKAKERD